MREVELLTALALQKPGTEIRMCVKHKVSVRTHYDPVVVGVGTTLMEAAMEISPRSVSPGRWMRCNSLTG